MHVRTSYDYLFINGAWQPSRSDMKDPVVNPATGQPFGSAPAGSVEDVKLAVAAARSAFDSGPWPHLAPRERSAVLHRFLAALEQSRDDLESLILREAGALRSAIRGVHFGLGFAHLGFAADIAAKGFVSTTPVTVGPVPGGGSVLGASAVVHDPIGVVGVITPFNFPFYLNISKVGSALAAGNTVVLKPSPLTPLEGLVLGEAALEAGLPPGVLNIVTGGADAGEALVVHPGVDMVSFTGSDTVGSRIGELAARSLKRVVLELGGKSALVVRADADPLEAAVAGYGNITHHAGQGCALLTRHVIHRSLYDRFVAAMVDLAAAAVVGDPADGTTTMGPLISENQRRRVAGYVDTGEGDGATVATGGRAVDGAGFFYLPTVLADVDNRSTVAQEEIFGPVGVVIPFDTDDEAVTITNDSQFGLAGAIFSRDTGAAFEMARRMRTGGVRINAGAAAPDVHAPFAGWKRSGIGVEHGEAGILEFTLPKAISFRAG